MNEPDENPLEPAVASLLEAERRAVAPQARLERVWARVAPAAVPSVVKGWPTAKVLAVAMGTFAVGGVVGATLHARFAKAPAERVVYVERPAPQPSSTAHIEELPAPVTTASSVPSPIALPTSSKSVSRSPAPPAFASSLAAERAMLDDARAALVAGDPGRAIELTEEHARRFATPELAEEREAIAIQALVNLGHYADARARAARFRAASPHSLFLSAVDKTLESIP